MRRIETTIDIDVTPEQAWAVLVDLDGHAEWNPFMSEIRGVAAVGERLTVTFTPPGRRATTFRPTVTAADPVRRFEWLGRLGIPGLFDGRHRFDLEPLADGRTRLVHSEEFRGVLVPLLWRSLATATRTGFEQLNAAFAARCVAVVEQATR